MYEVGDQRAWLVTRGRKGVSGEHPGLQPYVKGLPKTFLSDEELKRQGQGRTRRCVRREKVSTPLNLKYEHLSGRPQVRIAMIVIHLTQLQCLCRPIPWRKEGLN
jgi:hypothetical protein